MTITDLMRSGLQMGVHCHPCGRHVVPNPATLPLAPELPVPSLEKRFSRARAAVRLVRQPSLSPAAN
jgi:hypothetical protein